MQQTKVQVYKQVWSAKDCNTCMTTNNITSSGPISVTTKIKQTNEAANTCISCIKPIFKVQKQNRLLSSMK